MHRKNILVVDDNPTIVSIVRAALKSEGYTVSGVYSGEEALEYLVGQTPDLIILDIMMPRMSGMEALKRIKASSKTSSIPVIMLTALDKHDDVLEAHKLGAEYYMAKPFRPKELIHNIERVFEGEKQPSPGK